MTREAQAEVGAFLAEHLNAIQPDLERLSQPYRVASEYRRRVEIAEGYIADHVPCTCGTPFDCGHPSTRCARHDLERILAGDE